MISIREESVGDYHVTRQLTTDAFAGSEFGHNGEADLVDSLRNSSEQSLSLVACAEDQIVGHILFTPVVIRGPQGETTGMGLGPMSVATNRQNQGIGSSLVDAAMKRLSDAGCPFVVVLGHPDFYPRFGFLPASTQSVSHGFEGIPQDVFFYKTLAPQSDGKEIQGKAYYQAEFGPQHAELD